MPVDPTFKVISTKNILESLRSQAISDKDIENRIYTLNVIMEIIGFSLDQNRRTSVTKHWKKADKQKAKSFHFVFQAIADSLSSDIERMNKLFPQQEKAFLFMKAVAMSQEELKQHVDLIVNPTPTCPRRNEVYPDLYEEIRSNTANTESTTNAKESTENSEDSNSPPVAQPQTSTQEDLNSSRTPAPDNMVGYTSRNQTRDDND